ncbi:MAG: hypothetical protein UV60_C0018G0009 [Parcubacteria group bacterium GW2011_GWA2_43_11]|nr:MAG: hypothetical protein UV60_C0018G0009 [Parcubacteria group bacterium GW2011_GWA2_43_11]
MTRIDDKKHAIFLRRKGYSYSFIKEKIPVSKSTLSAWLSSVPYKANPETIQKIGKARAISGEVKAKIKMNSIEEAKHEAKKEIGKIDKRDLFMLGLGLYLGEGSKTEGIIRIINSNPDIICLSLAWFKKVCCLKNENFAIRLHLYPDNDKEKCIAYWSKITGIPSAQFQKTQIDERVKKISKRGKLPFGTAHLNIRSNGEKKFGMFLSRKINAWTDEVTHKAGLV